MSLYHTPVMLSESVEALITNPQGTYADATFGGGGHTAAILSRLDPRGKLIAFDRDGDALGNAPADPRFTLIHNNFRFIENYCRLLVSSAGEKKGGDKGNGEREISEGNGEGRETGRRSGSERGGSKGKSSEGDSRRNGEREGSEAGFDGILADLGVSSHQFDTPERGFSFRFDAPLDMRMNREGGKTAADVIANATEEELARILSLYGEVENAGRAARCIIEARSKKPILTTGDLTAALERVTPKAAPHKYLAKVCQALRIEVNDEMRSLEKFLDGAARSLRPGGRLVVITYHSLEDRMVKNFIKTGRTDGVEEKDIYGRVHAPLEAVNRKPITPSEAEISSNTRSRSAKLRVAVKKEWTESGGSKNERTGNGSGKKEWKESGMVAGKNKKEEQ